MKKSLLAAAALALSTGAFAQLPDGSVAPDFTGTDLDGNTWQLYDLLDQGYTVVMDISAAWCGPCWSYHNSGALEDLYNTYGPGTSYDKVMVLFIEGESTNSGAQITGSSTGSTYATFTQGDWTAGTPYPIIDDASIADAYAITYFPTIYTICPNRILVESSQISTAQHWAIANACPAAVAGTNAAVLSYNGESIACGPLDMPVTIQNMGTSSLTSLNIAVKEGATTLASQTWSGSLTTYQTDEVSFAGVNVTNPSAVTVEITTSDANASDNSLDPGLVPAVDATQNLYFNLLLDYYCSETTWKLKNASNTTIQQGGPYNCAAAGGGADANQLKTYNWTVPMGCYKMYVYDSYGDGLLSTAYNPPHPDGYAELKDGGFNTLWTVTANFGAEGKGGLNVSEPAGINDNTLSNNLSLSPNPSNGDVMVRLDLATTERVNVTVYNLVGEVVMGFQDNMGAGSNFVPMDLSQLENGIYMFNITVGSETVTKKVTLTK